MWRALIFGLFFITAAQAQTINIGQTGILTNPDSENANLVLAQQATLSQQATLNSMSFYVTSATGNLQLGIYDASGTGGGPGKLLGATAIFEAVTGWNTQPVTPPAALAAGTYWLAYLPSDGGLSFVKQNNSGACYMQAQKSTTGMPAIFSTSLSSCTPTTWSLYATVTPSQPAAVNGTCGSSNGGSFSTAPTTNLCSIGTALMVTGSGPWNWSCAGSNGGTSAQCSAQLAGPTPINGACGSLNGVPVSTAPTANLCSAGTATSVTGTGPWDWACTGSGGGTTAQCTAPLQQASNDPTSGVLPPYNDVYDNWSMAGLVTVGGIPTRTTVCATVNPSGGDDFFAIQNAIDSCPAGQVVQLGVGAFSVKIADLPIQISTGITLRGGDQCTGQNSYPSPYCGTSINVSDGAVSYTGGMCGSSANALVACPNGGPPVIAVSPVAPGYNFSWAQCGNNNVANNCGAVALTADAAQGQTTISVASTAGFSVGQVVLIDEASGAAWQNDPVGPNLYGQVWAAPDWLSTSGSPATGRIQWNKFGNNNDDFGAGNFPYTAGSSGCWYSYCDRATSELHIITAVGVGALTFDSPLTVAFRQSDGHNAQVYPGLYANQSGTGTPIPFLQYASLENLSVLRGIAGGVTFEFCQYCWSKNLEVGDWYGGGVDVVYTLRSEINRTYIHHAWDSVNNGGEYPLAIDDATTETLVDDSITAFAGKGMVARAAGGGNVVAYNDQDDTMYDSDSGIGDYWVDMGLNGSHYSAAHHILFEGNWADNIDNDNTHGNQVYHVYFRNWATALRTPFTDASNSKPVNDQTGIGWACGGGSCTPNAPGPLRGTGPMMHDYWFAYVGNVMGTPGVSTAANGWTYDGSFAVNPAIWMLGWNSDASNPTKSDPNLSSAAFLFRHGNYDTVNGSIADWQAGYSQTLPDSFYTSAAPAAFSSGTCTYPWPWVTSNGSTQIQANSCGGSGLPAKARFDAGTPFVQP
jgi:hypothetical protein